MRRTQNYFSWIPAALASFLLLACGGGGDSQTGSRLLNPHTTVGPGVAAESIEHFNRRRAEMGLTAALARNSSIDAAAQGHSDYQAIHGISHEQIPGQRGFTGATLGERLTNAGYHFKSPSYAQGEVIIRTQDTSGANAAEDLIAAIYHRFVIFEPAFREVGAGATKDGAGNIYVTTNFAVDGYTRILGRGNIVIYPYDRQTGVNRNFFSDQEVPDPVPSRNEVGYPVSVHADLGGAVSVQAGNFTLRPRGGSPVPVQLLTSATDAHTVSSVAAIIPLDVLASRTTYDVQFNGSVDGIPVLRSWSFTTN